MCHCTKENESERRNSLRQGKMGWDGEITLPNAITTHHWCLCSFSFTLRPSVKKNKNKKKIQRVQSLNYIRTRVCASGVPNFSHSFIQQILTENLISFHHTPPNGMCYYACYLTAAPKPSGRVIIWLQTLFTANYSAPSIKHSRSTK